MLKTAREEIKEMQFFYGAFLQVMYSFSLFTAINKVNSYDSVLI